MYYFFTVAADPTGAKKSAQAIIRAQHCDLKKKRKHKSDEIDVSNWIKHFSVDSTQCFKDLTEKDMHETFWIGHSNTEEFGEFTVSQFVRKFAGEFNQKFGNEKTKKNIVKHVYLISCEVGLTSRSQATVAQSIADRLYDYGFIDVEVHAVSSPPSDDMQMIVSVINTIGMGLKPTGEVSATLYSQAEIAKIAQMENRIDELAIQQQTPANRKLKREMDAEFDKLKTTIMASAITFLITRDIKLELVRPHNTFYPQHPDKRAIKSFEQELFLTRIQRLANNPGYGWSRDTIQQLMHIKEVVGLCKNDGWKYIYKEEVEKLKPFKVAIRFERRKLYAELKKLSEAYTTNWLTTPPDAPSNSLISPAAAAAHPSSVDNDNHTHLGLAAFPFRFFTNDSKSSTNRAILNNTSQIDPKHFDVIVQLLAMADTLLLESQAAWFTQETKKYKATALRELSSAISLSLTLDSERDNWLALIDDAVHDKKLVKGLFSHRTLNYLLKVQREFAEPTVKSPLLGR